MEELSLHDATFLPAGDGLTPESPYGTTAPSGPLAGGPGSSSGIPAITPDEMGAAALESEGWAEGVKVSEGGTDPGSRIVEAWQSQDWVGDAGSDTTSVSVAGTRGEDPPVSLEALQVIHDKYWGRIRNAFTLKAWGVAEGFLWELGRISTGFLERSRAGLSLDQERMIKGRITEMVLQRLTTYRMRGMMAPQVVGVELSRLAVDQDLSWEHKVKIGVQKGNI